MHVSNVLSDHHYTQRTARHSFNVTFIYILRAGAVALLPTPPKSLSRTRFWGLECCATEHDEFGRWLFILPSYVATEIGRRPSTAGTTKMRHRHDTRKRLNFQRPFLTGICVVRSGIWMLCPHLSSPCVYYANGLLTCGYCIYVAATQIISLATNAFSHIWTPECFLCAFRYGK